MSYDLDALLDRRRLKRRLRIWQAGTLVVVVVAALVYLQSEDALLRGERIARVHIDGVIVRDEVRTRALARLGQRRRQDPELCAALALAGVRASAERVGLAD